MYGIFPDRWYTTDASNVTWQEPNPIELQTQLTQYVSFDQTCDDKKGQWDFSEGNSPVKPKKQSISVWISSYLEWVQP